MVVANTQKNNDPRNNGYCYRGHIRKREKSRKLRYIPYLHADALHMGDRILLPPLTRVSMYPVHRIAGLPNLPKGIECALCLPLTAP